MSLIVIVAGIAVFSLLQLLRNHRIYSFFESYKLAKTIQGPPLTPLIGSFQFVGLNAGTQKSLLHIFLKIQCENYYSTSSRIT